MNTRMNRARLNIGVYLLAPYARTEAHIKDIADAYVDFIVCMDNDRTALDLFEKYGIGAIVSGVLPSWWGGDGSNAGKMREQNPMQKYVLAAERFCDHPSIWGLDIGDEPSALDLPYYGEVFAEVNRTFTAQFPYLNLYPNYASVSQNSAEQTVNQLGTRTYEEYIERYCRCVASDYICYDFYLYSISVTKHYENLLTVSEACRRYGRSMWTVLQVNSKRADRWISENNLRFQAYSAMAFGTENIIWACYTAGWWHNQVLDGEGNKTEQYEKMKKVNREIRAVADEYMKYRCVKTHFVGYGEDHPDMRSVSEKQVSSLDTDRFYDVHTENNTPLVVGEMVSRACGASTALMICVADDPHEKNICRHTIVFKAVSGKHIFAVSANGMHEITPDEYGTYRVFAWSNDGVLILER